MRASCCGSRAPKALARYNYFKTDTIPAGDVCSTMHGKPLSLCKQWEMMIAPIWSRRANYRSVTPNIFAALFAAGLLFAADACVTQPLRRLRRFYITVRYIFAYSRKSVFYCSLVHSKTYVFFLNSINLYDIYSSKFSMILILFYVTINLINASGNYYFMWR